MDSYISTEGSWLDGKRTDALFIPTTSISESLPPVLVEIQNVVDMSFIHRLNKYCNHIIDQYNVTPICLTICIKSIRHELSRDFIDSTKSAILKKLASDYWAKEHLVMTPDTIMNHIEQIRATQEPLHPLVALGYVLTQQKCSLLGLHEYREDPHVILLYKIAKEVIEQDIQEHEATVDVLMNVTTVTHKQFKRIYDEVCTDEEPDLKRIKGLAKDGITYTEACLHKYRAEPSSSSSMPPPVDLPKGVVFTKEPANNDILPSIPTRKKDDMEYARRFKEEYLKGNRRMNWKLCFEKGREKGFFKSYKDHITLKNTFNNETNRQP